MKQIPFAGIVSDSYLESLYRDIEKELVELRWFAAHPYESLLDHSRDYAAWHKTILKTSRMFSRWILPIWTNSTVRLASVDVYGKRPSPIEGLGKYPVSRFMRYLLFEVGLSQEDTINFVCDHFDYPVTNTRPMVRRIMRNFPYFKELWEKEKQDPTALKTFEALFTEN